MTHPHPLNLACHTARLRALLLAAVVMTIGACGSPDRITDTSTETASDFDPPIEAEVLANTDEGDASGGMPIADEDEGIVDEEETGEATAIAVEGSSTAAAFRGGVPFGTFHLPLNLYGRTYTGTLGNISPGLLLHYLQTARRNGARVMVSFSGNEKHFKNRNRSFSMEKWKQRVNRFRRLNLTSYIKDGTLIGHYLIDEPHDPANWGGRTVPRATIDEMARYSKQLWPGLPTIARAWPKFLKGYRYRYLDAAWAQYSARFGAVSTFMRDNVRDAKASGLALVIGMNQLAGGDKRGIRGFYSGRYAMSGSQLRSWGAQMLADPYPCAFLSWAYNSRYMNRSDIKSAKSFLAGRARSKGAKSCRGSKASTSGGGGGGGAAGDDDGGDDGGSVGGGGSSSIKLKVSGRAQSGRHRMTLNWSGARGSTVDVYRNGAHLTRTQNDGHYVNSRRSISRASYTFKICQRGTNTCSKSAGLSFR